MSDNFQKILEDFFDEGCDYVSALFPDRPYEGQAHTDGGERGKQEVHGVTMRDVADCYIIGAFRASGLEAADYPKTIFDLPWEEMDPKAVSQNMTVALEKRMGIYPNVPRLRKAEVSPVNERKKFVSALERMYQLMESMDLSGSLPNEALREAAGEVFWSTR